MSRLLRNTEAITEWCERHGLDPARIPESAFEVTMVSGDQWRVNYELVIEGRDEFHREQCELVVSEKPPPLWVVR